jgi:hypothetical protein
LDSLASDLQWYGPPSRIESKLSEHKKNGKLTIKLINVTPEQTSFVIHRFKKKKFCDIN